jgi:hypothetical protein
LVALITDAAGNVSTAVALPDITQTQRPAPPVVTQIGANAEDGDVEYEIDGTAGANTTIRVWRASESGDKLAPDALAVEALLGSATAFTIEFELPASDITPKFLLTASDAGNSESAPLLVTNPGFTPSGGDTQSGTTTPTDASGETAYDPAAVTADEDEIEEAMSQIFENLDKNDLTKDGFPRAAIVNEGLRDRRLPDQKADRIRAAWEAFQASR